MANGTADVFLNPTGLFDRLVLFTDDAIVVANPAAASLAGVGPGSAPADWKPLVGLSPSVVPYGTIRKVSTNKHGDTLSVRWKDASRDRLTTVSLKDAAVRDEAWERLRRRLGQSFAFSDVQFGAARAALTPIGVVLICALVTWALYLAAGELAAGAEPEVRGRNALVKQAAVTIIGLIGPTGVLIAGGLATTMAAAWGVARVRTPPRMLTLVRK
jgi:hypothetical protein